MGYRVDFDALDTMYAGVNNNAISWSEKLGKLSESNAMLIASKNMSGAWAESLRTYLETTHGTIVPLLQQLISLLSYNCLLYKNDYQSNIDTALHAIIEESELSAIKSELERKKRAAREINGEVSVALARVRDIFSVSYRDVSDVLEAHDDVISYLLGLDESIKDLEKGHLESDFSSIEEMIASLRSFILELRGKSRTFKSDFSMTALAATESFQNLFNAHLAVSDELERKADAIDQAINNENQRIADIQKEYEERQKKAQTITWIVTGVCIIGSIVAIVATGGAATPLVVGAISAASSAIIAGTNNLANEYVQDGDLSDVDWGAFGKDVAVGGVTGFVTGYLGAAIGGGITSGLSKTTLGSTMLQSSNTAVRIGTGAVIGSVSEVGSGIVTRGAETLIRTGDLNEAADKAFDGKNIVTDAVIGGVSGGYGEYQKTKPEYIDWENTSNSNEEIDLMKQMEADGEFDIDGYDYGPIEVDPDATGPADQSRRMATENSGTIIGDRESGNFDFVPDSKAAQDTMAKYGQESIHYSNEYPEFKPYTKHQTEWGEVDCEVKVGYMSDQRASNYAQADEALAAKISEETGSVVTASDIENYRKDNRLTWHEVEDRTTMQLVPRDIHESARHSGGVSQAKYEMAWGNMAIDDGSGLVIPRADAESDMINHTIDATKDALGKFPESTIKLDYEQRTPLEQKIEEIIFPIQED